MNFKENKELCFHRQHHLIWSDDCDEEIEVYPCEYMINDCIKRYGGYCSSELEPLEQYCLQCPYRNKDMGEDFEINVDKYNKYENEYWKLRNKELEAENLSLTNSYFQVSRGFEAKPKNFDYIPKIKVKEKIEEYKTMYNNLPKNPKEHLCSRTEYKIVIGVLQKLLDE